MLWGYPSRLIKLSYLGQKKVNLKATIKWLKVLLGILVFGIVVENAHIFARIDGMAVKLSLILCLIIIGLKAQLKI